MKIFFKALRRRRLKRLIVQFAALFVTLNLIIATIYLISNDQVENKKITKEQTYVVSKNDKKWESDLDKKISVTIL